MEIKACFFALLLVCVFIHVSVSTRHRRKKSKSKSSGGSSVSSGSCTCSPTDALSCGSFPTVDNGVWELQDIDGCAVVTTAVLKCNDGYFDRIVVSQNRKRRSAIPSENQDGTIVAVGDVLYRMRRELSSEPLQSEMKCESCQWVKQETSDDRIIGECQKIPPS